MERLKKLFHPKALFLILLLVGSSMLLFSCRMPNYTRTREYERLIEEYNNGMIDKDCFRDVFEKNNSIRNSTMDIGNGFITLSLFVLVFLYIKGINEWNDFLRLKAAKEINLICLSNMILLLQIPGTYFYYWYRGYRGDYPPFADSIGIPIYYGMLFCLYCIVPLNLVLFLALIKSNLKTQLFVRYIKHKGLIVWECFFYVSSIILIGILVSSIIDGDHTTIISCLVFIYIELSLRAGKINYHLHRDVPLLSN